ncbi:hypothetical protein ACFZDI_24070 [Streptomyces sp. NPDC007907]|uniref:hypothetical protein n=1 Tax=Streptomyces sp. NPDC007907 TaxID=3364789 RepID=UPI0036E526C9
MPDRGTLPSAAAPEVSGRAAALPREALRIASGYAFSGPALHLGALLWDGQCLLDVQVRVPQARGRAGWRVRSSVGTGQVAGAPR